MITGIAGFIGSNLALRLQAAGWDVSGVDAFTDYYAVPLKRDTVGRLKAGGIEVLEADLGGGIWEEDLVGAAASAMPPYLENVDAVVHLAAQPGISAKTPWEDYNRNNVVATHRLLEAARVAGVKRFVNVSSSSVYGLRAMDSEVGEPKPASWYGETKLAAELEVMGAHRLNGFPACSLRLFSVYGERERPDKLFPRLIRAIAKDEEFPLFEGSWEHQRSFTYVGDICEAISCVLGNWEKVEGEIFNVGTDQCFTTGEAIETVQEIMGKKARIEVLPPRPGDQAATHANIEKVRNTLGWEPRTSLREGLERMVKWYRAEVEGKLDWR
ncbi:NAD-dependent epimerase/dehydratase family protein [Pelagicoccus sp. SDUM812005]|uniref:NAD-dependent epimerase/dehydratase family protein n=1 Tax=Pelagicoccus sp. SDUM812005 TaxID=3041257 RepID=UPI00280D1B02|nr:NAD-dependent epimerase/dehydratase family protein [Pelagicoccus sp. SDUM812005]MDQ8180821.1 NAD-dependent epimerase/dehydratase family protein [Pelagicoccus sp. SDUM812005]